MANLDEPGGGQLPVPDAVRAVFLDKRSGLIEVSGDDEDKKRLFFADGELHLPEANPIAQRLAPLLSGAGRARPHGWLSDGGEVKALMARIARIVHGWRRSAYRMYDGRQVLPADLVGPLPTALLVMEWAAMDKSEAELVEQLGGSAARWVVRGGGVPASVAALLDPQETVLAARLAAAQELSELVHQAGDDGAATLRRLARLAAVGVIQRERGSLAGYASPLPPEVLRRLAYRVETSLRERPLELGPEAHREQLRELLASSGGKTHYELLEVADDASTEEVHAAYDRLGRRVHPSHAPHLGLEGREPALWLLFECATDAYLTLSDPARRRRYDVKVGNRDPGPSPEVRKREAERLAESYHRRALLLLEEEDYHFAVELLKQAVLADPRPEYYLRLGEAQAKNPNWLRHALQSFEQAIERGYPEPGVWSAMGRIFEELGEIGEARRHFTICLERRPGDPEAEAGLARLETQAAPEPRRRGLLGLFGRRRKEVGS